MADIPYQNASQVEQALAERENAEAYGQQTLVDGADKVLASFGITSKKDRASAAKARRAAAEESDEDAASSAPVGRSTAKKSTAKK